ncbi:hypothetical protein MMC07_001145 [Pseudocyphellaria aurata]|nr:hypothetical protein [Pseudocyphellaria aurata]
MADLDSSVFNTSAGTEQEAPEEIAGQPRSGSNAELTLSATSTRNWIMWLPPEIRNMIYRQVLQLPEPIPYYTPILLRHPAVQAVTGILRTCRSIRRESTDVFFRANFFCVRPWVPSIDVFPSRRINDMIQNIEMEIPLSAAALEGPREQFMCLMRIFGQPGIERGTLRIRFLLHIRRRHDGPQPSMSFYLVALGQFASFRSVEIDLYHSQRPNLSTAKDCDRVKTALQDLLGPATSRAKGHGLTFFPRKFRSTQRMRGEDD